MGMSKPLLQVKLLWRTPGPLAIVSEVASQAMFKEPTISRSEELISYLYSAGHRSVFEHVSMSLRLENVSRSFMAQITRHRMASYMCSSQHYQDYTHWSYRHEYAFDERSYATDAIKFSQTAYNQLLRDGVERSIARQVLPEAMLVNMYITANAREWAHIFNLRLCKRNTPEMLQVTQLMYDRALDWFPALFAIVGPDCKETQCRQGKMACHE